MDTKRKALALEPDYRKPALRIVPKSATKSGLNRQFRDIIASYIGYPSERAVVDQSTLALVQAAALQYRHPKTRVLQFPAQVSAAPSDNRGQEVTP